MDTVNSFYYNKNCFYLNNFNLIHDYEFGNVCTFTNMCELMHLKANFLANGQVFLANGKTFLANGQMLKLFLCI